MESIVITETGVLPALDQLDSGKRTGISATALINLRPGASYVVDVSGTPGTGSSPVLKRKHGDGTFSAYDDSSGFPQAFAIDVPQSGIVQLDLTGITGASMTFAWTRQLSKLG